MITDNEYLERVIAGIQSVTMMGAEVNWNETINARQFDIVARFMLGLVRYVVVVEVKNRTRKASASDLDAFVLKARDQNANKAIFVTAAGFQQGAITVAKRHAIDLFTVTFDETAPSIPSQATMILLSKKGSPKDVPLNNLSFGEVQLIASVENARLQYVDGAEFELPSEQSQMNYYCRKTQLGDGRSLHDVFQVAPFEPVELNKSTTQRICIDPPQPINPPDQYFFPAGTLSAIECTVTGRNGRLILGNTQFDPNLIMLPVIYTNVITGEKTRFTLDQLPLGLKRVSVGSFYFIHHPLVYYYCDAIHGDQVRWHVIESFQNGEKINGTFTQSIEYSTHYIPVTDKKLLDRLRGRLDEYLQLSSKKV